MYSDKAVWAGRPGERPASCFLPLGFNTFAVLPILEIWVRGFGWSLWSLCHAFFAIFQHGGQKKIFEKNPKKTQNSTQNPTQKNFF